MEDCAVAVVTDNLAYSSSYQAFERPPDTITINSLVPRGIRRFFMATDLQAKPVNDDYSMFLTATLPENFAYIMRSFNCQISQDRALDWDQDMILRMLNHIPGQEVGTTEQIGVLFEFFANPTVNFRTVRGPYDLSAFSSPMWSVHTGAITFRVEAANTNNTVSTAGFVISHCEFLEYDLNQAQRYYINTPIPVLGR